MNNFSKKSPILKAGIAVVAIVIAASNYAQSNQVSKSTGVVTVSEANADTYCNSKASSTCKFTTPDGFRHETTNAENI